MALPSLARRIDIGPWANASICWRTRRRRAGGQMIGLDLTRRRRAAIE